jgi:hypothetical protein
MEKSVKTLAFLTIISLLPAFSIAQLKIIPTAPIATDIRKVLEDYPNRFSNLTGELIIQHAQSSDYSCNFIVRGAEESSITLYSSVDNNVCSWQAVMLTTGSFEKARQKYKSLFNQLNNLGFSSAHLKGQYEIPTEEMRFWSVVFSVEKGDDSLKKLKVEISMRYELMEWKVRVLVYDKEREDDENR